MGARGQLTDEVRREIARRYEAGESSSKIAASIGTTATTVTKWARKSGVRILRIGEANQHPIDHHCFDQITEESAYWCGFMMADGSIRLRGGSHCFSLALHKKDRMHLEKFKAFLKSGHKITDAGQDCCSITCTSRGIVERLKGCGVVPNKTFIAEVRGLETNRDFWRGAIDGDGFVSHRRGKPSLGLSGSERLTGQFRDFIRLYCPDYAGAPNRTQSIFTVHVVCRFAQTMMEVLYRDNAVALERKDAVAQGFIGNPHKPNAATITRMRVASKELDKGEIIRQYIGGQSLYKLSAAHGVSVPTLAQWLKDSKVEARTYRDAQRVRRDIPYDELVADYNSGTSSTAVAEKHGTGSAAVLKAVRAAGFPVRKRGQRRPDRP